MRIEGLITLFGEKPGKTLTVMGGVHGDEPCGVQAVLKVASQVKLASGKVNFVIGSPRAVEAKQRQIDMNLNRAFRPAPYMSEAELGSYERARALELMALLEESCALLDVHSSMTPGSPVFIICEPHSFGLAARLPAEIVSYGWDIIEPGGTDYYMNRLGGKGVCIECGFHEDPEAPRRARQAILAFLTYMEVVEGEAPTVRDGQRRVFAHYLYFTVVNFKLAAEFGDFTPVSKGQLIGHDGGREVKSPSDGLVIFCRERDEGGKEAFIIGREYSRDEY